jgi:hypothetical protein
VRLLEDSPQIERELIRLMRKYHRYDWAVAWAGSGFSAADELLRHRDRIGRICVGLHFYQTHPDFLRAHCSDEKVRFVLATDGVFHPKIFYFANEDGHWEAIVGSANFTSGGLGSNSEAAILVTDQDEGADAFQSQFAELLNRYWDAGTLLSTEQISAYSEMWQRRAPLLRRLAGRFGQMRNRTADDGGKAPTATPLLLQTWQAYYQSIRDDKYETSMGRLAVLTATRKWFSERSFSEMDSDTRKKVAGFYVGEDRSVDWLLFGSMKGAGYFKNVVIENEPELSSALDAIPSSGPVSRDHYLHYVEKFKAAFGTRRGGGDGSVATATRVLAMKRPDYFVCIDSKNRSALCRAFGVRQSIDLQDYWDSLCERIYEAAWWDSPRPSDLTEKEFWHGRVAFLDALFYVPES